MSYPPQQWGGFGSSGNGRRRQKLQWKDLCDIKIRPLEFVLKPWLQKNSFHLLVGLKGVGKGTWMSHWAAKVTRGEFGPKKRVIWIAIGEDSYATDVRPRIEAAGGDSRYVTVLTEGTFSLPDAIDELESIAKEKGDVGLVIIDPVGGTMGGANTNYDFEVRPVLAALNLAADRIGCIIIGVRHFSIKMDRRQGGTLSAILGASDWVNIPRAVLCLNFDDEDPDLRHLHVIAGNRVRDTVAGLMFRIIGHRPEGWAEEVTLAKELGDSAKDPNKLLGTDRNREPSKTDAGRQMIGEILAAAEGYAMESDMLDALVAEKTGLAVKTIKNSRWRMKDAGLIRPVPDKDEFGTVLRWVVVLTSAGVADFVTSQDETGEVVDSDSFQPGPLRHTKNTGPGKVQPKIPHPASLETGPGDLQDLLYETPANGQVPSENGAGSGDLQGKAQVPPSMAIHEGPGSSPAGEPDFVTAQAWVQAEGHELEDDSLVVELAARFGIPEDESFGLVDIAYDCRRPAT